MDAIVPKINKEPNEKDLQMGSEGIEGELQIRLDLSCGNTPTHAPSN